MDKNLTRGRFQEPDRYSSECSVADLERFLWEKLDRRSGRRSAAGWPCCALARARVLPARAT